MDTNDTTNPYAEAPEAEAPEVATDEASEDLLADASYENDEEGDEAPEEEEELDIDGNPIRLPKTLAEKLKARMMMQADYTQKTQALAEQRKAIEQERQVQQWEAEAKQALFTEEAQLLTVRQRLEQFQGVNWAALAQQDLRKQNATLKQVRPEAKPVPTVATGKTRSGPSNPDKLSADEWLKWRESSLAKQRQRNR